MTDAPSVTRRRVMASGLALAGSLTGCTETTSESPRRQTHRPSGSRAPFGSGNPPPVATHYETVVNAVGAGADPTGTDPITTVLETYADDDTLLYFPDGTYAVESQTLRNLNKFGIVAASGATPTLVPSGPAGDLGEYLLTFFGVRDFRLEGFRLDFRTEAYGGRVQVIGIGDFTVRNIDTVGTYPEDVTAFRFDVRAPDAVGLIERLTANTTWQTNASVTGVYVGHQHEGVLRFRDCHVSGFPDNGLYASAPGGAGGEIEGAGDGPVHVEGGSYRNNNVANVRLGSTGSTMRDTTIVVDRVPPHSDDDVNARGLRLRGQWDQVIENCDIRFGADAGDSFGAIVFHHDSGRATIRNCRLTVDRDSIPAVNALEPDTPDPTGPLFEDVVITGDADHGDAVVINGRDGTTFRRSCLHQTGAQRNGVRFVDASECAIVDSTVDVMGTPITRLNSVVTLTDVTYDGGC